ncbi:MAG: sulfopyruvate decarboxylase subunit alpha [Methanobacteriaceae archaeon]|nr:sulfopyruvate decarboxylase subunit alpha [Methanobacteriaceae archaeon]MDO9627920.1 sulfopyruvate decarboxylase subunit alpha [Methanobacteriaceae archaeon]
MDSTQAVYQALKEAGINFIVSIPCVNLSKLLEMVEFDSEITHVPVTREEEGFGIAAGAYMGGMKPAILMQNSGLGNSINVLTSLYKLYKIPILMVMSHRGTEGEFMSAQIPMGKATPRVLESLELPYFKPSAPEKALKDIKKAWEIAESKGVPVGILLEITFW